MSKTPLLLITNKWFSPNINKKALASDINILGISCFYHDAAAAIIQNGVIVAAAQEERFTRKKHDDEFPSRSIEYCLEESGLALDQLSAIVYYDKPLLKFERLLETYYAYAPKGLRSFLTVIPVWLKKKMYLKKVIYQKLSEIGCFDKKSVKLLFTEHHLSHAASAFYPSSFVDAAILTIDGVGEWATASIGIGKQNQITVLKELHFPHSLGLLYTAFTYYLGFKVNSGEYKLMGLAPYGRPDSAAVRNYIALIKTKLIDINSDGSIWMNQRYFDYATGFKMAKDKEWFKLFGIEKRTSEGELTQDHCDLALAIQLVTEEVVILMAREAKRLTGAENLCLAGGVALNCVANGKLKEEGIFKSIFIQPAAGDAGGALGAALAAYHIYYKKSRVENEKVDPLKGSFLGPDFSDIQMKRTAKKYNARYTYFDDFEVLTREVSAHLNAGDVVGWYQGRMEFGPRALGNRSILGDARNTEMQKKLNLKIKYRESFRPFAPSILAEHAGEYFDLGADAPYMLFAHPIKTKKQNQVPSDYQNRDMKWKQSFSHSELPAITHVDFTARVQTVHQTTNPRYWQLIDSFKKLTGCPVIINTSFNVRGEPIVCTPEDAYRCFMRTDMDYLVLGNMLFDKKEQPEWQKNDCWQEEFVID